MSATVETVKAITDATASAPLKTQQAQPFTPVFWAIVSGILVQVAIVARDWIKGLPDRKRADNEGEQQAFTALQSLVTTLGSRVTELEKQVVAERESCAEQISAIVNRHDERVRDMGNRHDKEIALLRGEIEGLRRTKVQAADSAGFVTLRTLPRADDQ